ncbi:unnamed protein product [Effrenium voratum]|nr:unnamed protein product [Effrenium voratum]
MLELILRASDHSTGPMSTSMRLVRILRVAKITRAIRIVRLVKFIRSLPPGRRGADGGLTWTEASDMLALVSPLWQLLFEVLNVMTGVFCQSAIESAERDHELILQNVAHEKAKYFRAVRRLFAQLDRDNDGGVTVKEFKSALKDPSLHAVFDALEISAGDAWALFTQLDRDGDSQVNVDEFLEGCMLLKGCPVEEKSSDL